MNKLLKTTISNWRCLLFLSLLFAVSACARSPVVNYYALSTADMPVKSSSRAQATTEIAIEVPELPAIVDRGEIVEYLDENKVRIHEYQRWASDIGHNIRDALLTGLRAYASGRYIAYKRHPGSRSNTMLMTDVVRFELRSPSSSLLQVTWRVVDWDGKILRGPHDELIERTYSTNDIATGVAALSASIDELARRISVHLGAISNAGKISDLEGLALRRSGDEHDD